MPYLFDGVKESTTTTGTGDITLGGAVSGFRTLSSHPDVVNGTKVYGCVESGSNREIGVYQWNTGNTLTRVEIHSTLTSGTADDTDPTPLSLSGTSYFMCLPTAAALPADAIKASASLMMYQMFGSI